MSEIHDRLTSLRNAMRAASHQGGAGVDAYIVPSADAHQSEYLPDGWKRREFITGFDGSAGDAVIAKDSAGLWTDGRYWSQGAEQLEGSGVDLFKLGAHGVPSWAAWLAKFPAGSVIGVDPRTLTRTVYESLQRDLARREITLVGVDENLIDSIWTDRPAMPTAPIRVHPAQFAGKDAKTKLADLRAEMKKAGAEAHAITSLDAIAWLFNLRGADVACNPVFISYALVTLDSATLFVDGSRMTPEAKASLEGVATVQPYDSFADAMRTLAKSGAKFWIDEHASSQWVYALAGDRVVERSRSPVFTAKGVKNEGELQGMRDAHRRDGAAMVRFLKWLEEAVPLGGQTEVSISRNLQSQRLMDERCIGISFESIIGFGGHGAIIHYRPLEENSTPVTADDLLLIDSGGQYLDGTTDITRTVHLGEPTAEHRARFTAVLRAYIALATQRFPRGAKGVALDAVCRSRMWAEGLDYQHGTGHGVGAALNVHEEPPRLNSTPTGFIPIHPGMIFSNEPGFYAEGRFGIRLENLEEVVRDERPAEGDTEFLTVKSLTLCPMQLKMIDASKLSEREIAWLDAYHARVRDELTPLLDDDHAAWLADATRPLGEFVGA